MQRIGLTGGIASGKSVVAERLAEHGAAVIDHDALAREAVRPGSTGLDSIVEEWGDGVLTPDGELDRPATASDPDVRTPGARDRPAPQHLPTHRRPRAGHPRVTGPWPWPTIRGTR